MLRTKGGEVVTIRTDASVVDLLALLAEHRIGAVVVSDGDGDIAGIVSERDIVRHLHSDGREVLDVPVAQIMTSEVQTCEPHTELGDLERLMTESRIRHVPVVVDSKLSAIVSIGDVVKHRISDLQAERDQLSAYIQQ